MGVGASEELEGKKNVIKIKAWGMKRGEAEQP